MNHVFYEYPPAVQVWALSQIPSNLDIFPIQSLFSNMDHLFWRVSSKLEDHQFAWILWYKWKGRNNKVFSNLEIELRDTLKLAETESLLWTEAQNSLTWGIDQTRLSVPAIVPYILSRWCFTDGLWKNQEIYSGQGWYSTLEGFDGLMGAKNIRVS